MIAVSSKEAKEMDTLEKMSLASFLQSMQNDPPQELGQSGEKYSRLDQFYYIYESSKAGDIIC